MSSTSSVPDHNQGRPHRLTFAVWRNPLARPADRLQAFSLLLAAAIWLIGLPVAAVTGTLIWSDLSATAQDQQHSRTMTTAVLLADAPHFVFTEQGVAISDDVPASARWSAPDGTPRTGTVTTKNGGLAGQEVTLWIDPAGTATDPPTSTAAAAALTVLVAAGIWLAWGALLFVFWSGLRCRLNRQRSSEWDRRWEQVEPLWTHR
jgi:hypothetical protein